MWDVVERTECTELRETVEEVVERRFRALERETGKLGVRFVGVGDIVV